MLALSVALLSAAALAYEVLLLRLFAETWWHSFAATVISLALLGYGISGTALTVVQAGLVRRFFSAYRALALSFAVAAPGSLLAARLVPFNPLDLAWSGSQWLRFSGVYLVLAVPFFLAGSCIGLALRRFGGDIPGLYAADLAGAGAGAAAVLVALHLLPPERCAAGVGVLACCAVLCCGGTRHRNGRRTAALIRRVVPVALAVGLLGTPPGLLAPVQSEYKGLSRRLLVPGARVLEQRSGSRSRVHVVGEGSLPFRHAPGLSLNCRDEIPPQQGVFVDGELAGVLDRGGAEADGYLDCLPLSAPHVLLDRPRVAVLAAGTGSAVRTALHHGASEVVAVEADPLLADLLTTERDRLPRPGRLRVVNEAPRSFLAGEPRGFDLIQVTTADGGGGGPPGIRSAAEGYLLTVEGVSRMLARLLPGGLLAVTTGLEVPPRASVKVFATAAAALERLGVASAGKHLAWFRDWSTATVLVAPAPLSREQVLAVRRFCSKRAYDVAHLPGLEIGETNRTHVLAEPYLFRAAQGILSPERRQFHREYPYFVEPATDDRPFFWRFFRPGLLRLAWAGRGRGGEGVLPWGYLLHGATLGQALAAGAVLVLLPLVVLRERGRGRSGLAPSAGRVGVYFGCLGLGFLLVEVALLKRMGLLLGHPVVSAAVVLAGFLLFAGLGSRAARRTLGGFARPETVACCSAALGVAAIQIADPAGWGWAQSLALEWRAACALAAVAPVAFLMGMPFPLGLARLAAEAPRWVPWAWGVNGFASVVSAALGVLLAVHGGLSATLWSGAVLYGVAGWAGRRGRGGGAPAQ